MKQPSERLAEGLALLQSGHITGAEAAYRSILEEDPRHAEALAMLGALYLQRGNLDDALRLLDQSLDINPNQPLVLNNRGVAFQQLGRAQGVVGKL